MMRRKIVAGNWKMNKDHREGAALAGEILAGLAAKPASCEVVLLPPFTSLPAVMQAIAGSAVAGGGQDLFYEDEGAFTGEVSGPMLKSLGCASVLVGHSERRHVIGEGSELLAKKLRAALRSGLEPIYCVGELLEEREAGRAEAVVERQLRDVLAGLSAAEIARVVLAYEPVWAIGTGRTATPEDASSMHAFIRRTLERMFGEAAREVPILYGGSVKPENAAALLSRDGIDGFLVGGASLKAASFLAIMPR
jgi:triosephosphate isomerase